MFLWVWGDGICLLSAANTYGANGFVFYRRENCPPQLFQPAEQSGENMFLEFDSTDNCQHYSPLVRRSDLTENDVTAPDEQADGSPQSTDAVIAPEQQKPLRCCYHAHCARKNGRGNALLP